VKTRRGKVVVHKRVESHPAGVEIDLTQEDVEIDRLPRDEDVGERREPWLENEALMIPVYEEILVTETRLVLREVVRVQRKKRIEQVMVDADLRREVVEIETIEE
jgi:stress response protein YsnF